MSLISLDCLKFALITVIAYFLIPKRFQWFVLFIANLYFYYTYGLPYIVFIVIAGIVSYTGVRILEKVNTEGAGIVSAAQGEEEKKEARAKLLRRKKTVALVVILLIMSSWIVLKYGNFLVGNAVALISLFDPSLSFEGFSWALPLGISFYTFHAIGYVVDVYRKKYPAEKNFLKYFTFLSFFPHMIQGPFSRFNDLSKTMFAGSTFSYERLCEGAARILWGAFKKVVVADPTAGTVNMLLGGYEENGGIQLLFAIFLYGIRLYADFSGYMDIVCGFSHILGIELEENFKQPFFAKTIDEFWRRWHITLGKWFRDYVFYPVSLGKTGMKLSKWARGKWGPKTGKLISGYFAMIFVWTATGLWHGANWTYLVWGYLNLFAICTTMQFEELYTRIKDRLHIKSEGIAWKIFCMIRTYILISYFRFFSLSSDVKTALAIIWKSITDLQIGLITKPSLFTPGLFREEIIFISAGVLSMFAVDILNETGRWEKVKSKCPIVLRSFIYALMIVMIILMLRGNDITGGFMYANF